MWVADEFGTERKLTWIEDLIEKDLVPSHGCVFTHDHSLLITTHWDSHCSLLCSSKDMRNWVEHKVILQDDTGFDMEDSIRYTGFHYVDWHFDGNDDENIIMAVRTAYRGAVSYHNSNRLTYKVIPNWRQIVVNDRVERLAAVVNDL